MEKGRGRPLASSSVTEGVPSSSHATCPRLANAKVVKTWPPAPLLPITAPSRSAAEHIGVPGGTRTGCGDGSGSGVRSGGKGSHGTGFGTGHVAADQCVPAHPLRRATIANAISTFRITITTLRRAGGLPVRRACLFELKADPRFQSQPSSPVAFHGAQ